MNTLISWLWKIILILVVSVCQNVDNLTKLWVLFAAGNNLKCIVMYNIVKTFNLGHVVHDIVMSFRSCCAWHCYII